MNRKNLMITSACLTGTVVIVSGIEVLERTFKYTQSEWQPQQKRISLEDEANVRQVAAEALARGEKNMFGVYTLSKKGNNSIVRVDDNNNDQVFNYGDYVIITTPDPDIYSSETLIIDQWRPGGKQYASPEFDEKYGSIQFRERVAIARELGVQPQNITAYTTKMRSDLIKRALQEYVPESRRN
jgi:hypothetical protein